VDAADIKSRTTVPSEMPATPPPQPEAPPQPQQKPSPPQPEAETAPEPPQKSQVAAPPKSQQPPPIDPDAPGEAQPQQPPEPQPKQPPRPQKQATARPANPAPAAPPVLNLNLNPSPAFHNRGGSFAPTRPPGITRSGENDEFGRGVIRALQRTVPQLVNTVGRVTVRIILNTKGNLGSVEVLRPSGVGNIDQSVVFAVKQASFPIPPDNSTEADRTFFVTYIFSIY
jgi:TonB family protein